MRYTLGIIEKAEMRADLVSFSSTAVTIRNLELRAYAAQIK